MKQMRSRFRLFSLLLVCAFLVTLALCGGRILKEAGITLPAGLPSFPVSPVASSSPEIPPGGESASQAPEISPSGSEAPGTDNSPVPEYNVFGL